MASLGGHLNVVRYLITECKCDPHWKDIEFDGLTPLQFACEGGHLDII